MNPFLTALAALCLSASAAAQTPVFNRAKYGPFYYEVTSSNPWNLFPVNLR